MWPSSWCQKPSSSARGISVVQIQTTYHVSKLKNGISWLSQYDTWLRYLEKLYFMHTETRQISSLRNQEVSKEIQSDLVRKDVAEFNDKFYHFRYATLEIFKKAFNNYPKLKSRFLSTPTLYAMHCKNVTHHYYATIQDTKPHILS